MAKESTVVILFFIGFIAYTIGESLWLIRYKNVNSRRAVAAAALSNTIAITIGFFVSFVIFAVILARSLGGLGNVGVGEASVWAAFVASFLFPFLLLLGTKWLFVKLFKIESVGRPFSYAFAATLVFFFAILTAPTVYIYFFAS